MSKHCTLADLAHEIAAFRRLAAGCVDPNQEAYYDLLATALQMALLDLSESEDLLLRAVPEPESLALTWHLKPPE